MGAEVSQALKSDLEDSTLKELLSDEKASLSHDEA
jgi:hypothetical protein